MGKRKWTDIKKLEAGIIAMREAGKTRREIAEHYGLEKVQIKNWINRYNHARAELALGRVPKYRGCPRKDEEPPHQSEEAELKRLRMENQLLRDFLRSTERE